MVELIESNSQRLEENDREHRDFVKFQRDFQKASQKRHQQIMAQLHRILERLTPQNPNPN
jgi:mRNA-degrading endonuclease YafQ of YafQ-DinJ toxin-antitoxin module